jgi:phosphoribosylpyrophosphate synthetase
LSIAHLIGEAIGRITDNRSVSSLFAWFIGGNF